jgi:hypothetical protein
VVTMTMLSPADAIAEIAASSPGPRVGAFFDLDGTLVDGFTAAVHVGDRIRRRQVGMGELLGVFEAALGIGSAALNSSTSSSGPRVICGANR